METIEQAQNRLEITMDGKNGFYRGVLWSQKWQSVEEKLPNCFESGNWDGLRSEFVLVKFEDGSLDIARLYRGQMDGFEFCDWFDKMDFDFGSSKIVEWRPIERS